MARVSSPRQRRRNQHVALLSALFGLGVAAGWAAQPKDAPALDPAAAPGVVLDSSASFWRVFYTVRAPVVRNGAEVKKLPILTEDTPAPPNEWMQAEFDDSQWSRIAGAPVKATDSGIAVVEGSSPALALLCMRGRFGVTDPASAGELKLSLRYRGGVIVYVNGTEVGRANMPKDASGPDALADDYPKEAFFKSDGSPEIRWSGRTPVDKTALAAASAARIRTAEIAVPAKVLRKGANVLAVEIHRAPYQPGVKEWIEGKKAGNLYDFIWATCGLNELTLRGVTPSALIPNVARPKGFQVWNSQPLQPDMDLDYGDPFETIRPVKLVGARNGVCSGKVVVGNDQSIKNIRAVVTDLTGPKGGTIPATAIQVRYAVAWGEEPILEDHYAALPDLLDGLAEVAPPVVEVRTKAKGSWSYGAVCPVWITVAIPDNAAPGDYTGKLTITASDMTSVEAPVQLKVCGWQAPLPSEFHTIVDLIQSPETVAMQYNVPLWSDPHFKLLEKSLARAGYVGSWTLHIPLICHANIGNEQSMVRWIKKPDGTYKYDFTVLDRYLDLAEKHMGKPRAIALIVWDLFLGFGAEWDKALEHNTKLDKGFQPGEVPVSLLDEATGKITLTTVGRYDEKGKANWKALIDQLMERLKKRGLDQSLHIGHSYDLSPSDGIAKFWNDLLPGVHYFRYGHYDYKTFGKTPFGISDFVVHECAFEWDSKPKYGWKNPSIKLPWIRLSSERMSRKGWKADPYVTVPMSIFRLLGEYCIQSGAYRGFGRMGLDYWPVTEDERGQKNMLSIQGRYPSSSWRQSDEMISCIVPPGPNGALSSSKLEMMREGLQETEARIFLESVLIDPAKKGKLPAALATRAQEVLDARVKALQMNLDKPSIAGFQSESRGRNASPELTGISYGGMYAARHSAIFQQWFMESGWQQRSEALFSVAGEVAATGAK